MNAPSAPVTSSPSPAPPTAADNHRGIVATLIAMGLFVCSDSLAKLAREAMPAGEVMFVRGIFTCIASIGLVVAMGEARRWKLIGQRRVILRASIELCVVISFLTALGHLRLGDLTAIVQSSPLFIALACHVLGLEPMGWRRWLAVLVGFCGVLLIAKPGGGSFDAYALLAFASAVLVAARDLLTRRIGGHVPTALILTATSVFAMVGGLALGLVETWQPVSLKLALDLTAAGLFVTGGNFFMIAAYRHVDVAVVSPFRYSVIIWAGLLGFLVFGEVPEPLAILGAALIAGSGLYTVHRERVRARLERNERRAEASRAPPDGVK